MVSMVRVYRLTFELSPWFFAAFMAASYMANRWTMVESCGWGQRSLSNVMSFTSHKYINSTLKIVTRSERTCLTCMVERTTGAVVNIHVAVVNIHVYVYM